MTQAQRDRIEEAYTAAHAEALTLIEKLRGFIEDLPAPDTDNAPIDWGHVGSLRHICEQVRDLNAHFEDDTAG